MNVIPIQDKLCKRTARYLDAYVSNELQVETNQEVLKHLENCPRCAGALQTRLRLKACLRQAVHSEEVPAALRQRLQAALREKDTARLQETNWSRWALAVAALMMIALSGWGGYRLYRMAHLSSRSPRLAQEFSLSEQIAAVLRIGIGDHVHCVIDSHLDKVVMTPEQMAQKMGPAYKDLVPLIKERLPDGFTVTVGHRCQVKGREFIHMILKQEDRAVSVIITEKQGAHFPAGTRVNSLEVQGVLLHQDRLKSLEAAGFETKDHLAFVVSALNHKENIQIASRLAPSVSDFLNKL